ncbi:MAG TPA: glycosyltransferase family 2 protein [Acidimicrobiales bacterium]|nr:glycosyltransferase family 2 protein [Acidimicrobiales bacterium]
MSDAAVELFTVHEGKVPPPTVSVVIPTLNEAGNIGYVLDRIPGWIEEVIVVDGRSTDGTPEVARRHRPDVRIVHQDGRGKGNALNCGFAAATGDIIVMLDADGSTDPAEIPRFIAALRTGADFAKGTRFVTGGGSTDISKTRMFGNRALNALVNTLWGSRYTDLCYGYNAFWRRHLHRLAVDAPGFEVETLLNIKAIKANLRVVEVPSFESDRITGASNLHAARDGLRVLRTIVAEKVRPH